MRSLPLKNFEDYYEISTDGVIVSNKTSSTKQMKPSSAKSRAIPYPFVNLRKDNQTYRVYISRAVFETFGALPEDYYSNRAKYVVAHLDGDTENASFSNLKMIEKRVLTSSVFKGKRTTSALLESQLPARHRIFKEGIYRINQLQNLYLEIDSKYFKISNTIIPGVVGENAGSLVIRINKEDIPDDLLFLADGIKYPFYSMGVSTVLMLRNFKNKRPSKKHVIGYKDFNILNLTKPNLIWETASDRMDRIEEVFPSLKMRVKILGMNNLKGVYSDRVKSSIEKMHFVKKKSIMATVKAHGMDPDKHYSRVSYYLKKVLEGKLIPASDEVKELFQIEA
jgi:hypothetical protein